MYNPQMMRGDCIISYRQRLAIQAVLYKGDV